MANVCSCGRLGSCLQTSLITSLEPSPCSIPPSASAMPTEQRFQAVCLGVRSLLGVLWHR